jgi:hypothetical protein
MKRAFTVYYDDDSMELAKVDVAPSFAAESPLARADVLGDASGVIRTFYEHSLVDMSEYYELMIQQLKEEEST